MKTTSLIAAAAALLLAGGAASAQTAATPARAERAAPVAQADFVQARVARLTAMDANNDGSVSVEEMRAAGQARRAERLNTRFSRLDANGDGVISKTEFETQPAARSRSRGRMDRNAAHRARPAQASRRMHAEGGRAMQPVVIADARARAEQRFAAMDADHDGMVTAAERQASRQAARQATRAHRMERRAARTAAPAASSGD